MKLRSTRKEAKKVIETGTFQENVNDKCRFAFIGVRKRFGLIGFSGEKPLHRTFSQRHEAHSLTQIFEGKFGDISRPVQCPRPQRETVALRR